jgi:hypothetical protein
MAWRDLRKHTNPDDAGCISHNMVDFVLGWHIFRYLEPFLMITVELSKRENATDSQVRIVQVRVETDRVDFDAQKRDSPNTDTNERQGR